MKSFLVTAVLLGCAHAAPPWPRPSAKEADGGESLAPREAKWVAAAESPAAAKADAKPDAPVTVSPVAKPAAVPAAASEPAPTAAPAAEEEGEETIIIEIDDD